MQRTHSIACGICRTVTSQAPVALEWVWRAVSLKSPDAGYTTASSMASPSSRAWMARMVDIKLELSKTLLNSFIMLRQNSHDKGTILHGNRWTRLCCCRQCECEGYSCV